MTIKITITASAAGPGQHAWAQYEEKTLDKGRWFPSKRGPIPLTPDVPEELWIHDGQRVVVYEPRE